MANLIVPPKTGDTRLDQYLRQLKTLMDERLINPGPLRAPTLAELEDGQVELPTEVNASEVLTPPAPTGVTAQGGLGVVFVNWDKPNYPGHAYVEIFRFNSDMVGSATKLGTSLNVSYVDRITDSITRYYWVRFVNTNGVPGPFHAINGAAASGAHDPAYLLELLTGALTSAQLHTDLGSRIDLIDANALTVGSVAYKVAQEATARASAIAAEASSRATAITAEATSRASADEAITNTVNTLSASLSGNTAALQTEITTRASDVSALSTRIDTLVAQSGGNTEEILAAISQEQTARASADGALSSQITSVSAVAQAKNRTYFQTTPPTGDLAVGDVWYDSDDNNKSYRFNGTLWIATDDVRISANSAAITTEQNARAAADSALSTRIDAVVATSAGNSAAITTEQNARASADTALTTSVNTMQVTLGGHTTSIQSLSGVTDGLNAKYTVKIDNNGYVTGFGLASTGNTAAPFSSFSVRADSFYIANPAGPGIAPSMPFVVRTTESTINGEVVPVGVYLQDAFIQNGTITTAMIGNAVITDAKIAELAADKITTGTLDANRIAARSITADKIAGGQIAASEVITVGGTGMSAPLVLTGNGEIISNGTGGNKARFYSGDVEIYKNVPDVGQVLYKALNRIESGVATNNTQVTIPGYFKTQPKIVISPRNMTMYKASFAGQDQSIQCNATAIAETSPGSMVWRFTPVATLSLAAATDTVIINQSSGYTSSDGWTSMQYNTPANTATLSVTANLGSSRGNGISQNFYRTTRWRIEYYNNGWVSSGWATNDIGASTSNMVTSTINLNLPSAGTWAWRIYAECYDTNGSVFGTSGVEYANPQVGIPSGSVTRAYNGTAGTSYLTSTPGTPSGYAGWTLTGIDYSYSYTVNHTVSGSSLANRYSTVVGGGLDLRFGGTNWSGGGSKTQSVSNNFLQFAVTNSYNNGGGSAITFTITGGTATFHYTRTITNSTTPNNLFILTGATYTMATSQVLAEGSLNWVAVGD